MRTFIFIFDFRWIIHFQRGHKFYGLFSFHFTFTNDSWSLIFQFGVSWRTASFVCCNYSPMQQQIYLEHNIFFFYPQNAAVSVFKNFILIKSIFFESESLFASFGNMYIFGSVIWVEYSSRGVWARYMVVIQNFLCLNFQKKINRHIWAAFLNSNSYLSVRIFWKFMGFWLEICGNGFLIFHAKKP